ncbi:hypothetical protein FACS1894110_24640 [Spirochaetia bacterium]|nr:hypothetical protein FACS1894110_24640 [Spirochaetia bacterium]
MEIKTSDGKAFTGHNAENQAHAHQQDVNVGQVGAIFKILFFLPRTIGRLVGFVVGILLKLGIVGKILLSVLLFMVGFAYSAYFLISFVNPLPLSYNIKNSVMLFGSTALSVFLVVQFWRHGGFGATASIGEISNRIGTCISIVVFGTLILLPVGGLLSRIPLIGIVLAYIPLFGPSVLAVLYWFKQARKDNPVGT